MSHMSGGCFFLVRNENNCLMCVALHYLQSVCQKLLGLRRQCHTHSGRYPSCVKKNPGGNATAWLEGIWWRAGRPVCG